MLLLLQNTSYLSAQFCIRISILLQITFEFGLMFDTPFPNMALVPGRASSRNLLGALSMRNNSLNQPINLNDNDSQETHNFHFVMIKLSFYAIDVFCTCMWDSAYHFTKWSSEFVKTFWQAWAWHFYLCCQDHYFLYMVWIFKCLLIVKINEESWEMCGIYKIFNQPWEGYA